MSDVFSTRRPAVAGNPGVRTPQQETYAALEQFAQNGEREAGVVLPVGCGKSGCIALAPFAFRSRRALVVAPGLRIAQQLAADFDPSLTEMFYLKTQALTGPPFPEAVEIRGRASNRADLDEAEVVITNIQQLQGADNRWLNELPQDFFDLILFDEGHHSVAATWQGLKTKFPAARIINFSATPLRADGQLMGGEVIYSFPVSRAIQEGYVKRLKALVLNPQTLRYVRREDGEEITVPLDEVRRLGETDADFRRSIVTSAETLNTIVDASIRELDRIRATTGDQRHKIIASALNLEHCRQIVAAFRARGRRADFVHSREDGPANDRVFDRLSNHELDVIVQVRKLGEGFDHPYLSVAAVFSVFANLSPFVQFVGRVMRVIVQNSPGHVLNQGTVVFHAGANVASRWEDFQQYSEADQEFFQQLLPLEGLDFANANELVVEPTPREPNTVEVRAQTDIQLEEIPLLQNDAEAMEAIRLLQERGFAAQAIGLLQPVPTTRVRERQAARAGLDMRVNNEVGRILGRRGVNAQGRELDQQRRGRTNYVVLKAAIDRQINQAVERGTGERSELTAAQLATVNERFAELVQTAEREVFGG